MSKKSTLMKRLADELDENSDAIILQINGDTLNIISTLTDKEEIGYYLSQISNNFMMNLASGGSYDTTR